MRYLLKNGTVVSGEKSEQMDILIEGEKIAAVGHDLQAEDAKVIDAEGNFCFRDLLTDIRILIWKLPEL